MCLDQLTVIGRILCIFLTYSEPGSNILILIPSPAPQSLQESSILKWLGFLKFSKLNCKLKFSSLLSLPSNRPESFPQFLLACSLNPLYYVRARTLPTTISNHHSPYQLAKKPTHYNYIYLFILMVITITKRAIIIIIEKLTLINFV